jgi:predicted membrane-bound spermidine synthase
MLGAWDACAFVDSRAWHGVVPVGSLVMALVLGGGSLLALRRLERFEP